MALLLAPRKQIENLRALNYNEVVEKNDDDVFSTDFHQCNGERVRLAHVPKVEVWPTPAKYGAFIFTKESSILHSMTALTKRTSTLTQRSSWCWEFVDLSLKYKKSSMIRVTKILKMYISNQCKSDSAV